MAGIADRIMKRMRAKGRGEWVCTHKDFRDLGNSASVGRALSRLAASGDLRRVGRGLYDLPRFSAILKRMVPTDMNQAVAAIMRRDNIRIMPHGLSAANRLHLTNAVPVKMILETDGATRDVKVGNRTIRFLHVGPRVMAWHGKPSAPVAMALRWLGPHAGSDPVVAAALKRNLPDKVKADLVRNSAMLPDWAGSIVRGLDESRIAAQ